MHLCLNAIVRNELANLPRMLASVAPYISSYAIVDTGSTDGTPAFITKFMARFGIPGTIIGTPFENFSQARNFALDVADQLPLGYDYLLLVDADMELVVEDPQVFETLTYPSYCVLQKNGGLSYQNVRLVRRGCGRYFGVTHEYLSVPATGFLTGAWFTDHATGSNRVNKFARDIKLLTDDLEKDPQNGRSWFYLAQSYKEAGQTAEAINAYRRRIEIGGWDEEIFFAKLQLARCLRQQNLDSEYVAGMLAAYNYRRSRAEPLYELAKYYRERGENASSTLFSEAGMRMKKPDDILFLDDETYNGGLRDEFMVTAYYDQNKKPHGFHVCNDLALDPKVPDWIRTHARDTLLHYLPRLQTLAPSFQALGHLPTEIDGWKCLNPSVFVVDDKLKCILRSVNYTITESGHYDMHGDTAIRTRNYLLSLSDFLNIESQQEITSGPMPVKYDQVLGFEDMRGIALNGEIWFNACMRQLNSDGWCEQVVGKISADGIVHGAHPVRPAERRHEKNWSPFVEDGTLKWLYRPGSIVTFDGNIEQRSVPQLALDTFSGSSQLIPFDGGWLALMHEARARPDGKRFYQHRFVWFDHEHAVGAVSLPFAFNEPGQIEFAAGLAAFRDQLVLSYGFRDREPWLGTISRADVRDVLWLK